MDRLTDRTRTATATLMIDLVALAAFVVVGAASHDEGGVVAVFVRNAVPIAIAWLAVAWLVGTYRPPTLAKGLLTWVLAVPIGLVVRSAILGRLGDADQPLFFAVAMGFTLLFLAAGRGVAFFLRRRATASAGSISSGRPQPGDRRRAGNG